MYKLEKIGENVFFIKVLGTFPPSVANRFIDEFVEKTKELTSFSTIIDGLDFLFLNLISFKLILDHLKKNNKKLIKSAYVIANPILDKEIEMLLQKAKSPQRKIVHNFEDAKRWVGIDEIIIGKE